MVSTVPPIGALDLRIETKPDLTPVTDADEAVEAELRAILSHERPDDAVLGRIEYPSEQLEDLVLVRSDGRPTYNFVSPLEDALDGITHVIRGQDHVPNTPKQLQILGALRDHADLLAGLANRVLHRQKLLGDAGSFPLAAIACRRGKVGGPELK